jgi:ligand-binding sensor domain-containing protein/two-component sensor histidine kinase
MLKHVLCVFCLSVTCYLNVAKGQSKFVKPSFELSTQIINDLLLDKQGFLWIATDLGVSRFDGINVVNFTSPDQSSLAVHNLREDARGKIWFSNYTGQIFYIANERMHLLRAFKSENESILPRLETYNNELFVTTDKGLYIVNISTLRGKYVKADSHLSLFERSLAIMKNKVLLYDNDNWFLFKNGKLKKMPADNALTKADYGVSSILNTTFTDTALLQSNPAGIVRRVVIKNDSIKVSHTILYHNLINSISTDPNNRWINTANTPFAIKARKNISGYNISDLLIDLEGNLWIATLDKGIYVDYKKRLVTNELNILPNGADVITTITKSKKHLLVGTKNGDIILYNPISKKVEKNASFGVELGPVKTLSVIDSGKLYIGFDDKAAYKAPPHAKPVFKSISGVTQFLKVGDFTFITSLNGLFALPDDETDSLKKEFLNLFGNVIKYDPKEKWFHFSRQCRAISYNSKSKSLIVAFKNGLYYFNNKGMFEIRYKKLPVYATAICYVNGNTYVGTVNKGLLIFDQYGVKNISLNQGLLSTTILKFKLVENHLWIISPGSIQLMDLATRNFLNHFDLPSSKEAQITDVEELDNTVYLITLTGLITYRLDTPVVKKDLKNFLLSVKVNDYDIDENDNIPFSYLQNDIAFRIGIPVYYAAKDIYIKYRLSNQTDSIWHVTEPGKRVIAFHSLPSGEYLFQAVAVDPKSGLTAQEISYSFIIQPPWWKNFWFKALVICFALGLFNYFVISYYLNKVSFQQALYEEQQSIRLERQRISSEIHDDIGSGLFAIHLFADIAGKKRPDVKEIAEISNMVEGISQKIREIIWSTNIENDNLENLIYYIQFQITKMFELSSIKFSSSIPAEIQDANISTQVRRDLYLIVKEISHNAIKHSNATNVEMTIKIDNDCLIIVIKDNGVGYSADQVKVNSMGLDNIQSRIRKLRGTVVIEHKDGVAVTAKIPIKKISTTDFVNTIKAWQLKLFSIFKKSHIS